MVRQTSPLAAIRNFLVSVADVLDTVYFKLAEILGLSKVIGKRTSILYLAVASIFAFTILISLIVSIASTAKSKSAGPEPAITTENAISTSTTVTPDKTQSASVSVTYPHTIVSSKSTQTPFIKTTTNKQASTSPRIPPSTATEPKPQTSSSRSTQRSSAATTRKPQTSSSSSTRRTSPASTIKPPENPVHCMFVGDVLNLGKDSTVVEQYYQEKEMIFQIAESVLKWYDGNTVTSWAYGYVKQTQKTNFRQRFEDFTNDWTTFADSTRELMTFYNDTLPSPGGNKDVFSEINENGDDNQKANCLVFLSAMTNATGYTIKPKYEHYKKIVVVNMAGGDFSRILDDNRGTVVPVSQPYIERKNSNKVFKAILSGFLK